jgi:hypothetical protein
MKNILLILVIAFIATSCNLNAKKGSIGEIGHGAKKVYVYKLVNHQVIGIWTVNRFDVIHDPNCPCFEQKPLWLKQDSTKSIGQDINIFIDTKDKTIEK